MQRQYIEIRSLDTIDSKGNLGILPRQRLHLNIIHSQSGKTGTLIHCPSTRFWNDAQGIAIPQARLAYTPITIETLGVVRILRVHQFDNCPLTLTATVL